MSDRHVLLLTGGTGGFGAQLLDVLASRDDVARAYTFTHVTDAGASIAKVTVVRGDITQDERLGLRDHVVEELAARVTTIVHAAADTRFTAPVDALRRTNVRGTEHLLSFATRCRQLQRFCFLSTVYVAGKRTGTILEGDLEHDAGFVNDYERSKYEAELVARRWMNRLPLAVVRLSTVVGEPPLDPRPLGAIHQAIRLMYRSLAPMVPGSANNPVDLVASDYAAQAVAWLATRGFHAGQTFHVVAGSDTISQAELLDFTMETFAQARPAWRTRGIAHPALVDLETFELFRQSVDEVGDWVMRDSTAVISSFAPQLAYPKLFDDAGCWRALEGSGITRPHLRVAYARMVEELIAARPRIAVASRRA